MLSEKEYQALDILFLSVSGLDDRATCLTKEALVAKVNTMYMNLIFDTFLNRENTQ